MLPYLENESARRELLSWFYNLNKAAPGKSGVDRFFEFFRGVPPGVQAQRSDFVGVYDALQAAYRRGEDEFRALITNVMHTPVKSPISKKIVTPELLREAGGGVRPPTQQQQQQQ